MFDIGDGVAVQHRGDDSWGAVGQRLSLHGSFWNYEYAATVPRRDQYHAATVVAYIGKHTFGTRASAHTYVIEHEGHCYPARHNAVRSALVDPDAKRRAQRSDTPRLLKA